MQRATRCGNACLSLYPCFHCSTPTLHCGSNAIWLVEQAHWTGGATSSVGLRSYLSCRQITLECQRTKRIVAPWMHASTRNWLQRLSRSARVSVSARFVAYLHPGPRCCCTSAGSRA